MSWDLSDVSLSHPNTCGPQAIYTGNVSSKNVWLDYLQCSNFPVDRLLSSPNDGPHLHQVIDTLEGGCLSNWQLNGHRVCTQLVHHHLHIFEEISAVTVLRTEWDKG